MLGPHAIVRQRNPESSVLNARNLKSDVYLSLTYLDDRVKLVPHHRRQE